MANTQSVVSLGDLEDDVAELKELAQRCSRPTVKAMLTAECERLERELSTRAGMLAGSAQASPSRSNPAPARAPAPAPAPAPAVAAKPKPAPAVSSGPAPVRLPNGAAEDKRVSYSTIASFGWDQDEYGKDPQNVYVHLLSGMDGIGQLKERVSEPTQSREVAPASAPAGGSAAMPEQAGGPSHRAPCVRRCAQRATSPAAPST